jgi:hypothetical protein
MVVARGESMYVRRIFSPLLLAFGLFAAAVPVNAGGTVELTLVGQGQGSSLYFQEWSQALGRAGIRNVRIRSGTEDDKPGIVTEGDADRPVYLVTGLITSRNEVVLPGARFRRGDAARIATWLRDLAENGPATGRQTKSPLGLSGGDFTKVRKDLALPVDFSTLSMTRRKAVEKIAAQVASPLRLDADVARELADDKVEDELKGLSCGTALACVLRPSGYAMAPRAAGGQIVYTLMKAEGKSATSNVVEVNLATFKTWPIGWTTDKSDHDAVPALYESHNVNVQNVSAATALAAIGKQLRIPILLDRRALATYNIDPAKALVSFPKRRTTYSLALRAMLFRAKLKFEVRYDDAGSPFLWVTTNKSAD